MKRILCILSSMDTGGAETFLMKIFRGIDNTKYRMDFCINTEHKSFYEDEITVLGGRIFRIPCKSENIKAFKYQLTKIIRDNNYSHVLRITSNAAGFLDLKIAKKAGAEVTIVRSSNSSDGNSFKTRFSHRIGKHLYERFVDVKLAPSDLAAKYTFGKKAYAQGEVGILHNGLDLDVYQYDDEERNNIRHALGIASDTVVIGHIGRLTPQKNHAFLLNVFAEIKKRQQNTVLFLVGEGELKNEIRQKSENLGLSGSVRFLGVRADIPALLSAMDVFVFPSLYEGMPNAIIEAQATGLPCVISDTITKEANITGLVKYLPLSLKAEKWAEEVLKQSHHNRQDTSAVLKSAGYDIRDVVAQFEKLVF